VDARPGGLADHPVGDARGDLAEDHGVAAPATPPCDHVEALVELGDHRGDVARIVLQVAVDGGDHPARGGVEAGVEGRRLSEVSPEEDGAEPGPVGREPGEQLRRPVAAPVVDDDDLERPRLGREDAVELLEQRLEVLDLVVNGDDDGERRSRRPRRRRNHLGDHAGLLRPPNLHELPLRCTR
jgi:hypothetical protein